MVRGSYGYAIAQMYISLEDDGSQMEANANLIAAAPDMLECLERCVDVLGVIHEEMGNHRCTVDCPDITKHIQSIQRVIEKALG